MKLSRYIVPAVLIVLIASFVSCSRVRTEEVRNTITAADSLLTTAPHAALDTLLSIDSVTVAKLSGNLRADYALLLAEAEYKCYEPLADNEDDIIYAVNRFRKHGPEEDYARALMMQGAMFYDKGDAEAALKSYTTAGPIWEKLGDPEQLGLLHTRIGEVYRDSYIDSEAVECFEKALDYFHKIQDHNRELSTHITLASLFLGKDDDMALMHIQTALSMSEESVDRVYGILTYSLLMHYHILQKDYHKSLETIRKAFTEYGTTPESPSEWNSYNTFYSTAAKCFAQMQETESAKSYLSRMLLSDKVDSMMYYSSLKGIAVAEHDWQTALEYEQATNRLVLDIKNENTNTEILEIKQKYDEGILKEAIKSKTRLNTIILLAFLTMIITACAIIIIQRNRARYHRLHTDSLITSINAMYEEMKLKAQSEQNMALKLKNMDTAKKELFSWIGDLVNVTETIANLSYIYESNDTQLTIRLQETLNRISEISVMQNAEKTLERIYPGLISGLFEKHPWLSQLEKNIILLMCIGFSNSTITVILNIDISKLNSQKTRIAKKMQLDTRLSIYLRTLMKDYSVQKN